jgi:hypothetical protein
VCARRGVVRRRRLQHLGAANHGNVA